MLLLPLVSECQPAAKERQSLRPRCATKASLSAPAICYATRRNGASTLSPSCRDAPKDSVPTFAWSVTRAAGTLLPRPYSPRPPPVFSRSYATSRCVAGLVRADAIVAQSASPQYWSRGRLNRSFPAQSHMLETIDPPVGMTESLGPTPIVGTNLLPISGRPSSTCCRRARLVLPTAPPTIPSFATTSDGGRGTGGPNSEALARTPTPSFASKYRQTVIQEDRRLIAHCQAMAARRSMAKDVNNARFRGTIRQAHGCIAIEIREFLRILVAAREQSHRVMSSRSSNRAYLPIVRTLPFNSWSGRHGNRSLLQKAPCLREA
jgi:hypothetical protein